MITRTIMLAGLAGALATTGRAQTGSQQVTRRVVGDTVLVECHPETVFTKRKLPPVRPKKRRVVKVAKPPVLAAVPGDTAHVDSAKVVKPVVKKHHRRRVPTTPKPVATKQVVKYPPGTKVIQVCRDVKLPGEPKLRSALVPAWSQALAPVGGPPAPGEPETFGQSEEGGQLPPAAYPVQSGPVIGGNSVLRGGGIALIPAIFVAFLTNHDRTHDDALPDSLTFPTPPPLLPPEVPPVSTVPEPHSMVLMATGLLAVGGVVRRRKRKR